jgi:hypothetical protein
VCFVTALSTPFPMLLMYLSSSLCPIFPNPIDCRLVHFYLHTYNVSDCHSSPTSILLLPFLSYSFSSPSSSPPFNFSLLPSHQLRHDPTIPRRGYHILCGKSPSKRGEYAQYVTVHNVVTVLYSSELDYTTLHYIVVLKSRTHSTVMYSTVT